jgi:hypothetical protein
MSDDVELLPCPFCGGRAALRHEDDAWTPECLMEKQLPEREHGYIDFPWYWEKADAVKAWNTRHPAPLVWSSERPKVAGWYWVRFADPQVARAPWLSHVDQDYVVSSLDDTVPSNCQFAGPIPEPMEADR